jgi:nucleoside 2-deoxyribosyltransferase
MKKIYLAGPDVFRPDAIEYGKLLKSTCKSYGFQGLYPFDNEVTGKDKEDISKKIFEGNKKMIEECDIVLANCTPFRGPSVDAGTIWEIGFAHAIGKPVYGYTNIGPESEYVERVEKDTYNVENFGLYDNLMITHSLNFIFSDILFALATLKTL